MDSGVEVWISSLLGRIGVFRPAPEGEPDGVDGEPGCCNWRKLRKIPSQQPNIRRAKSLKLIFSQSDGRSEKRSLNRRYNESRRRMRRAPNPLSLPRHDGSHKSVSPMGEHSVREYYEHFRKRFQNRDPSDAASAANDSACLKQHVVARVASYDIAWGCCDFAVADDISSFICRVGDVCLYPIQRLADSLSNSNYLRAPYL